VRGGQRWTAMEFAEVCEAVAAELRARSHARAIAPRERLALFEWLQIIKDIVVRRDLPCVAVPVAAASSPTLVSSDLARSRCKGRKRPKRGANGGREAHDGRLVLDALRSTRDEGRDDRPILTKPYERGNKRRAPASLQEPLWKTREGELNRSLSRQTFFG
jgi:hypothetical protein